MRLMKWRGARPPRQETFLRCSGRALIALGLVQSEMTRSSRIVAVLPPVCLASDQREGRASCCNLSPRSN